MSYQSNLNRFKEIQINRKETIGVLIGAVAGLILGLLIGWVWWPVEWQGGTLDTASRTTQVNYVSAVADGYAALGTQEALDLAQQRLAALSGDALPALFDEALTLYGAQPNGGQQVANLATLASALGVATTALPTAAPAAVEAAPAAASASNVSSDGDGNGLWSAIQFLAGVLMLGGGAYLGWLLFKRLRPAARPAPEIGPLGQPTITANEAPARPAPPAYTAAQAAATRVQPVQPPAMGNVPPFEPEEAGSGATQVRSSGQPIAPSVAVPPTAPAAAAPTTASPTTASPATAAAVVTPPVTPGAFADDEEEPLPPGQSAAPTAAVGQRPGAAATGWVAGAGRIDRYPTLDRLDAHFTAGLPDFHITHNIAEGADGAYLGEYGVGVSERYGMLNNDPDQVVAIEVYIFDKSDEKRLDNDHRVILSEYADAKLRKHFEREKDRLGPIVAQPKTTLQLETRQFLMICTITDVRYSAEGIFERLEMALELKKKV